MTGLRSLRATAGEGGRAAAAGDRSRRSATRARRAAVAAGVAAALLAGAALVAAELPLPAAAQAARTPLPVLAPALAGSRCVEPPELMRRLHMQRLRHQRDLTVHAGERGSKYRLQGCIDCHASAATGSVAAAPTDFCVGCHAYAAVRIDCFECHNPKAAPLALAKGQR